MHRHVMTKADSKTSTWTGLVSVDDTALAVTDTRGPARPVVYRPELEPAGEREGVEQPFPNPAQGVSGGRRGRTRDGSRS